MHHLQHIHKKRVTKWDEYTVVQYNFLHKKIQPDIIEFPLYEFDINSSKALFFWHSLEWNLRNFSAIQILREIKVC